MEKDKPRKNRDEILQKIIQEILMELLSSDIEVFHLYIQKALGMLGSFFHAEYAYITKYDFDSKRLHSSHVWHEDSAPRVKERFHTFVIQPEYHFVKPHLEGKSSYLKDVDVENDLLPEREILMNAGIRSIFTVPFYHQDVCTGFLGMHTTSSTLDISDSEREILETFTNTFLHVLRKSRMELDLLEVKNQLQEVMDQQKDLILRVLADGTILFMNKALISFFELQDIQLGGNLFQEENLLLKNLVRAFENRFDIKAEHNTVEWKTELKNGEIRWIRWDVQIAGYMDGERIYQGRGVDITEIKNAYEALAVEKEKLTYTIEASSLGVWEWNLKENKLKYNRSYMTMIGYDLDNLDFKMSDWEKIIHPDDLSRAHDLLSEVLSGEKNQFQIEYRIKHKSGHYIWIQDTGKAMIYDDYGKPLVVFGTHYDVTRIKEEQQARQAILQAVETSPVMVIITDADGSIRYVNHHMEKVTGYCKEELIGKNPRIFQSGYSDQGFYEELWGKLLSQGIWNGRFRNKKKDGSFYWEDATLSVLYTTEGEIYGYVGIKDDVTERLKLEELLQKSEEQLRLAVEGAEIATWDWNLETGITVYSKQWKSMLGYEEDEVENSFEGWRNLWHPEEEIKVKSMLQAYLEGRIDTYQVIHRLRHKDGSYRWILARGQLLPGIGKSKGRFVGIHMDITSRITFEDQLKEANRKLAQAMKEAQSANALKSAFLANVSHEIRTPITAVLGFAHILKEEEDLSASASKTVEHIIKGGEHLLSLISDGVDLSKIETGNIEMNHNQFKIRSLLEDVEVMIGQQAEEKGLSLDIELPATDYVLVGDLLKIRQVLINLVVNAVKYTEQGKVSLRVEFESGNADMVLVRFIVKDTGIGIKEEDLDRVFEIFYRNTYGKRISGYGLGLQLCKKYAHLMNGDITVKSTFGEGSEFTFYLPLKVLGVTQAFSHAKMDEFKDTETFLVQDRQVEDTYPEEEVSPHLLQKLQGLVEEGNLAAMEECLKEMGDDAPNSAAYLEGLLEHFDYSRILDWVKEHLRR